MATTTEHAKLVDLISWIDENTKDLSFLTDERLMLTLGCYDVALEHQAAIALLSKSSLHGASFALLRVLTESLVRGLWLWHCAETSELERFKRGEVKKTFATLIEEIEAKIGTTNGVLSQFKATSWTALNGFTHTGMHQVSRRHSPGRVEANYAPEEVNRALGVAGALGLIAAGQLIIMADRQDLLPRYMERMAAYASV